MFKTVTPAVPADVPTHCRFCEHPLQVHFQMGSDEVPGVWQVTCTNVGQCRIAGQTINARRHMTDDLLEYQVQKDAPAVLSRITTDAGTPIEILSADKRTGVVWVRRLPEGIKFCTYVYALRAPGGAREIVEAIDRLSAENLLTAGQ